jgi:hypothetical protein
VKRTSILLAALLALVLAACGSDQTASSPTEAPTPTVEPTPEVTPEPEPTDTDPDALPSFDLDGDPELAARFPSTVGGQPLIVQSFRGDMFLSMGVDESFQEFLDATGAELEDVSVAFGGMATEDDFLNVAAFRVLGVSQDRLEQEFLGAAEEDLSDELERATIGGKQVWAASFMDGELGSMGIYVYTKDDTVYWMTGPEDLVAEILEALP